MLQIFNAMIQAIIISITNYFSTRCYKIYNIFVKNIENRCYTHFDGKK